VEKPKIMRNSRQSSLVHIIEQKLSEKVECFSYLGSIITNDARCTREIKSRIVMVKAALNQKDARFTDKLDLNLRKKP
jgi:hypothetical protein